LRRTVTAAWTLNGKASFPSTFRSILQTGGPTATGGALIVSAARKYGYWARGLEGRPARAANGMFRRPVNPRHSGYSPPLTSCAVRVCAAIRGEADIHGALNGPRPCKGRRVLQRPASRWSQGRIATCSARAEPNSSMVAYCQGLAPQVNANFPINRNWTGVLDESLVRQGAFQSRPARPPLSGGASRLCLAQPARRAHRRQRLIRIEEREFLHPPRLGLLKLARRGVDIQEVEIEPERVSAGNEPALDVQISTLPVGQHA